MTIRRIGVLTGGGDAPGLNAVIRALVRTAHLEYNWEVIGIQDGFEGLVRSGHTRPLHLSDVSGILPRGGTILGSTNRGSFQVPADRRQPVTSPAQEEVKRRFRTLGLDALVVIGGDGSLRIAQALLSWGIPMVGIPKTIDNDLNGTDYTFGYHTALDTATDAIDKLHTTAESHKRVMVVEVMGRDAGWIALESGLGGGADVILIPEIPYDLGVVCQHLEERAERGANFSILVIAEGAAPVGGTQSLIAEAQREQGAMARLGGVGQTCAAEIIQATTRDTRVMVLGHLQRGGGPNAYDRVLATRFGAEAAHLVAKQAWGQMVALHGTEISSVPIATATASLKLVPVDGQLVRTTRNMSISFGDL